MDAVPPAVGTLGAVVPDHHVLPLRTFPSYQPLKIECANKRVQAHSPMGLLVCCCYGLPGTRVLSAQTSTGGEVIPPTRRDRCRLAALCNVRFQSPAFHTSLCLFSYGETNRSRGSCYEKGSWSYSEITREAIIPCHLEWEGAHGGGPGLARWQEEARELSLPQKEQREQA